MKTALTEEIQSVIIAMQDYATFLRSYHMCLLKNKQYDWWKEAKGFYGNLNLPPGMAKNNACFDAVMNYPIDKTLDTEMRDLPSRFEFGF